MYTTQGASPPQNTAAGSALILRAETIIVTCEDVQGRRPCLKTLARTSFYIQPWSTANDA